ncbi:sigma 54-interacting transcriptional regulator [Polyangium sp. y55x31]|uniref:sigma 54-interacting transcriptional regulator n=1 Tax=Polyangium sp. y55x31 TaxID=3042688 RepID=UPI002482DA06|nr:sigma 54-interacting transcriptional regulator [Polyangium sp. y55x31]MDI1477168.1 sigma 54-interacting transcriptional regulator [Polyangium sp. y55x31]
MTGTADPSATLAATLQGQTLELPSVSVIVNPGGAEGPVIEAPLGMNPLRVGTGADCDIVVPDPRVSRVHAELRITEHGVLFRDLGSKNGSFLGQVRVFEAILPPHVALRIGGSDLSIMATGSRVVVPLSTSEQWGSIVGRSLAMRALFAKLLRASPTDATILLLGESGTGKEVLAREIHAHSRRKDGPFVIFDCAGVAPNLIESELFGYVRGAFTGASGEREGLLAEAAGGTLFIDEIGELPLDLQPKLLRALESRQYRRLGANTYGDLDVRVVAATHRNLKAKIAEGSFREDLYYRLAVVEIAVPALRDRRDDIQPLVERFLSVQNPPRTLSDLPPNTMPLLEAHDWPGNVRELRNMVTRLVLFPDLVAELGAALGVERKGAGARLAAATKGKLAAGGAVVPSEPVAHLMDMPLPEAREMLMEQFERAYVTRRLEQSRYNISRAAEAMGVSRQLAHRLVDRYGLKPK